ncbi:alkaline phosphatase family protein [Thalassomonas viridans]|uniref:Alkaline phosphatase family protein n=1 Tax=Thalassomonas viridans TaxID=137584 RepID=A0AAF0C7F1_9GAMM|nr:alkaline phosphatase D family protein [Thalassomonas viridans]WDE02789.1 alkaline phosphatase family protein [Thalassomonas viridans]
MKTLFDPDTIEHAYSKLGSMAIVGHTTTSSCKIWVRAYRKGPWRIVLSEAPFTGDLARLGEMGVLEYFASVNAEVIVSPTIEINESTDLTATFSMSGLKENTRYYYALISDIANEALVPRRTELGSQNKYYFRTLPANPEKLVFGYYSCNDPFSQRPHSEAAWPYFYQVLKDKNAAFCIGGGDQIYVDTNKKQDMYSITDWLAKYKNDIIEEYTRDGQLDEDGVVALFVKKYRMYYRLYWNFPSLQQVFQHFPQYMTWDDHEILDGWGSYTKAERQELLSRLLQSDDEETNGRLIELLFQAAKQVFFEYQHAHNPDTQVHLREAENSACVWDYGYTVGQAAVYVLDVRGHHDYERAEEQGNALLGDAQMQRLQTWLERDEVKQAKAVFIATAVPVVHWGKLMMKGEFLKSARDDLRDEWEHESNHKERNKMLDMVMQFSQQQGSTVTFLSGDVHCASVYRISSKHYLHARVFNATSSGISRKPNKQYTEALMAKDGKMTGSDHYKITCLNNFAGKHNFMTVTTDFFGQETEINVDLHWPSDDDDITSRRTRLE